LDVFRSVLVLLNQVAHSPLLRAIFELPTNSFSWATLCLWFSGPELPFRLLTNGDSTKKKILYD